MTDTMYDVTNDHAAGLAVCAGCSVVAECEEYASSQPAWATHDGVWAGKTPRMRRRSRWEQEQLALAQ